MTQITVITVGTLKEKYLIDACAEYKKRLSQFARVNEISLKEERIADEDDKSAVLRALDSEADAILEKVPSDAIKIALCVEGKEYSSEELASLVSSAEDERGKIALIIGSSHGLSERVKRECRVRLSFSKMTFPHQLMRVILYEQLYRSYTIIHNKRYHK